MILKKIMSILLTTTLLSQSILPVFAMDEEKNSSKNLGKSFSEIDFLKQAPVKKYNNNFSEEYKREKALVTERLRGYLTRHTAGIIIQPMDLAFGGEDAVTVYDLLKDDPTYSFTLMPLELLQDEDRGSADYREPSIKSATSHKLSKRVVGKKDKTAAGILHYALFEGEVYILLGQRNDNGGWCNLGGESEGEETPHHTASRESKEESNGIYAPHPDLLSHQPFIDTITEKNNNPFFYRMFFQDIKYLSSDIFKKKLLNPLSQGHNKEYTDFKWVKASDLWGAIASGNNTLQVEGASIQLYGPLFQSLSTKSGESMLCKLWLDKNLKTRSSDIYFNVRESFNHCYQVGSKWTVEEFAEIQKEFYLPKSINPTENNKTLAYAVAAHGMAMVQLKRKFQEIKSPTAPKTPLWNPKCEKTLSQIHLAMVLGDQYKEPEDFKEDPNPRRAANIKNIKTFISQNNDADYWQTKNQDRKISPLESDYEVLADILDWDEENRQWPMLIHGASDSLNNLFKAFTYLRELIGVRSLNQLLATRGTDIYFKEDKTIWDMINRTGAVQNNETSNAMIFLNFVLFATHNVTRSTSSSIEYFTNNHSVTPQDNAARFEEAMALCGFSKPDYSYFHSLFEQFYKYKHPTFENSVLIAISQNPEGLDDYNYPTPGGGSFIDNQDKKKQSTAQFVHGIQNEIELQRHREQKLQWEFEHPLDHESTGKYRPSKPQAQSGRVRFDSFSNDTERKKSLMPENRRFLESGSFLNLDLVRTCAFDRFPLSDAEKQAYDAEMRKTTVHIIADWLAEHTQGIPGSFKETPVIKTIYAMAYEKIMGEKPEETLPIDGFRYLAQNSNKEAVEGFISTCMDIFEDKNETIPFAMAVNFLPALVKYGSLDLFNKVLKQYPKINLNDNFPNIEYHGRHSSKTLPLFNMLDRYTPKFSDIVKMLIDKGLNTIERIADNELTYKIMNELVLYPQNLEGNLQGWFNFTRDSIKEEAQHNSAKLMNAGCFNLISSLLGGIEDLKIGYYLLPTGLNILVDMVKTHKTLKSLAIEEYILHSSATKLLAEGLKENATLEILILPKEEMFDVMSILTLCEQGAFKEAPWFKEAQAASYASLESIQQAIENRNWPLFTDLIKSSKIDHLDFTKLNVHYSPFDQWMLPLIEGLKGNSTLRALTLREDWHMQDIMIELISTPQGLFTKAPWFREAWQKMLENPGEYLKSAACDKNDRAILTILKNAPEEIELGKFIFGYKGWFATLVEELAQDEPYLKLNLNGIWMLPDHMINLAEALKTNTKLKSLNHTKPSHSERAKCLADGLKVNKTLENLSLSPEDMTNLMGFLMQKHDDPFRQAPWFIQTWKEMTDSPEKYIKIASPEACLDTTKNHDLTRQIICETQVELLDLTKTSDHGNSCFFYSWINPVSEGLSSNKTIQTLKITLDDFQSEEHIMNLTTALQANTCLTQLVLEGKSYKKLPNILESLRKNENLALTILDLSFCKKSKGLSCHLDSLKELLKDKQNLTIILPKDVFEDGDLTKIKESDRLIINSK